MAVIPPALLGALISHGASVRIGVTQAASPLELHQLAALAHQHGANLELHVDAPVGGNVLDGIAAAGAGNVTFDFTS
jgi:hypothetical protein